MVNVRQFFKMKEITRETVLEKHSLKPRRRCFASHSGLQTKKENGSKSFSANFSESIKPIFEAQTNLELSHNPKYNNYFRMIKSDEELEIISSWQEQCGSLVFLRDCLDTSLALDTNFDNETGQRTEIGDLEYRAKNNQDQQAMNQLADGVKQTISELPFYKDADLICSVPPRPDKKFDLPSSVTALVSAKIDKQDVTKGFVFGGQKSSVKISTFDEKWNVWRDAQISFQNSSVFNVNDKTVVLIDDKYQSGITIQYIAMKLQEAGAHQVYGLSFVKTLRDTDNV